MSRHTRQRNSLFSQAAMMFLTSVYTGYKIALCADVFSFQNFRPSPGFALIGNVTETRTVDDFLTCALACIKSPRCFSFNFGGSPINNHFTCELCDSLEVLDPQNLQSRPGFDFYQVVMDTSPCPCQNGGNCAQQEGKFTCECPLEIREMPYIDNKCNVEMNLTKVGTPNSGVFHTRVNGPYKLNFDEAKRVCELLGATLASPSQLDRAWQNGYQVCSYGWLSDGTTRYPMQRAVAGCGNRKGIIQRKKDLGNAFCYKSL